MNAYHQPGVDKNVAAETTNLQALVVAQLRGSDTPQTAEEIASCIGHQDQVETVYKLLERLARDRKREIAMSGGPAFAESFWMREAESIGARATDDSMSGRRAQ
jgi:hypothetical protein